MPGKAKGHEKGRGEGHEKGKGKGHQKHSCQPKEKPAKRPWHKEPCPPPFPNPVPPPLPTIPPPPRTEPVRFPNTGRGECWTCAFWEGPLVRRPNVGTCELTTMLADGEHPFQKSLAKVELDAGRHSETGRYALVTNKHFGCAQWKRG